MNPRLVAGLLGLLLPAEAFAAFDPAAMREEATFGAMENDFAGAGDVLAADLDADGLSELVVVGRHSWSVLEHDPVLRWRMRAHRETTDVATPFLTAAHADLDGDGMRELVILQGRVVHLHDARTLELVRSVTLPPGAGTVFADVEPPAGDEIVGYAFSPTRLEVSRLDGGLLWSLPLAATGSIAVGQADGDPSMEIVVATDAPVLVDALSRSVQWTLPERMGWPAIADVDGDGVGEVLSSNWTGAVAWDAVTQSERWRAGDINGAPVVVDADGDGDPDVVGSSWVLEGATGARLMRGAGAYPFDAGDFDGDCWSEAAGVDMTFDIKTLGDFEPTWSGEFQLEPPGGLAFADADADGSPELLRVAYVSITGLPEDWLHAEDLRSRTQARPPLSLAGIPDGYASADLLPLQLDADPQLEIVHASWIPATLHAVDAISGAVEWSLVMSGSERITSLASASAPGGPVVAVALSAMSTSSIGTQVRLVDAQTGLEIWRSMPLMTRKEARDVRVADLDGDGDLDVALVLDQEGTRVLAPPDQAPAWAAAEAATSLEVADLDGDGAVELLTGTRSGEILVRDGATRTLQRTLRVASATSRIRAIRVADVDGDGLPEIVATWGDGFDSGARTRLGVVSPSDGTVLWESEWTWGSAGEQTGIVIGDADGDGATEIAIATHSAIRAWEHAAPGLDGTPPAFAPGTLAAADPPCCPGIDLAWPAASDAQSAPVTYEIHRSPDPAFIPSPGTLAGSREAFGWRDVTAAEGADLTWVVVPVDRVGNRGSELRVRRTIQPPVPAPNAPTSIVALDNDPCEFTGITVSFVHDGLPAGVLYDLLEDGEVVGQGITSPATAWPWPAAHAYSVRARHPECGAGPASAEVIGEDLRIDREMPWITDILDLDACAATGLSITFTHPGFAVSGHYELLEDDGTLLASPITSPWTHVPAGDSMRDYVVRAVEDGCASGTDSISESASDLRGEPDPPFVWDLTDSDPCARSPVRISYSADRPPSSHFDLWKDGAPWLSGLPANAVEFTPEDGLRHDYVLRLVDAGCRAFADSLPFSWTDLVTPCPAPRLAFLGGDGLSIVADPIRPLFYAATAARTVVAVSHATDSVVNTLNFTAGLGELAVEPDGSRLYVAVPGSRRIDVVDLTSFTVIDQIVPGGTQPCPGGLAVGDGRLYASCDDGLSIIDTAALVELAFHPLPYGVYADSRLALSGDGATLFALQRGWSPSSLYAHDVRGDGFVVRGEECCHGCVSDSSLLVSRLTGQIVVGGKLYSSRALFHEEGNLPVSSGRGSAAQSRDGTLLVYLDGGRFVLVDTATKLPWHRTWLGGYGDELALSSDDGTVGIVDGAQIQLVTITGAAPNIGGIRLSARDAQAGLGFVPYLELVTSQGSGPVLLDVESGTMGMAEIAPVSDVLKIGTGWRDFQSIPVTITAGAWTDLGDVPMTVLSPPTMASSPICVSPPLQRGRRQVARVHVRNVRPGCSVRFDAPGIVVHGTSAATWSVLEVDVTVPPDLRLGLSGSVHVTDTGGTSSYGPYWMEDAPPDPDASNPDEVTGLRLTKVPQAIELTWDPVVTDVLGGVETVARYEVLRLAAAGDSSGASWMTTVAPLASWADPPTEPGVSFFLVRAVDAAGNVGDER